MKKIFQRLKIYISKYVSTTFIFCLCLAASFWYATKLSYTYTAQIPVHIRVGDEQFEVECVAETSGYNIMSHRYFSGKKLVLSPRELILSPVPGEEGVYKINLLALQNAISLKYSDMKIVSVGEVPDIKIVR